MNPLKTKYRNVKTTVNGIKFDSKKESKRFVELELLQRAGLITDLKTQVSFELIPSQRGGLRNERTVKYIADFTYIENGKLVVEDAKGFKTTQYVLKRKLMKMRGCEVVEV